ncbi:MULTISPECIES: SRPBCC family protein [Phenylobacterium]|jgi:hypothetical protein|uniref:SRPBCC family protein n=1 Tax=Phenylobacterium conjunctum TaxID=1298959 RepID=A0ABW3SWK8_9CAUL
MALKTHKAVAEEYLAGATAKVSHSFGVPAAAVWAALLDAQAWTQWLPITKVTWTSPQPFGVGTTRTVEIGDAKVEEYFFAWEEGKRMAFRFAASPLPISAAVEDYRVVETAGGCELHWAGRASAIFPLNILVNKQLAGGLKSGMPKLEAIIRAEPARFGLS